MFILGRKPLKLIEISLLNFNGDFKISLDDEYKTTYEAFMVFTSNNNDYIELEKHCSKIFDEIIGLEFIDKVLNLPSLKTGLYVYFKDSDLSNFDKSLSDLKQLIRKNNPAKKVSIITSQIML